MAVGALANRVGGFYFYFLAPAKAGGMAGYFSGAAVSIKNKFLAADGLGVVNLGFRDGLAGSENKKSPAELAAGSFWSA